MSDLIRALEISLIGLAGVFLTLFLLLAAIRIIGWVTGRLAAPDRKRES